MEIVWRCRFEVAARCLEAQAVAAATSLGQEARSCWLFCDSFFVAYVVHGHGRVLISLGRYRQMGNWAAKLVA